MSNFTRIITDYAAFRQCMDTNQFLQKAKEELIQTGRAFLAFRNDNATIYYNGSQLCSLYASNGYEPSIYDHYLPLVRSQTLRNELKKENYTEDMWRKKCGLREETFTDVFEEILDNIEKEQSPESVQASRFYQFSPLNPLADRDIVLLDVEAAFSFTGVKTDRIDLVFYHTKEKRLMFIEVKRLSDSRLYPNPRRNAQEPEVVEQLGRYRDRLNKEKQDINEQYNNVVSYYNTLSGENLPAIPGDSVPVLGLLLVEFTLSAKDRENKKSVLSMLKEKKFGSYAVGDTSSVKASTLKAMYKAIK